ncbi:MAG TPA: ATP-binding protein [Tepidisphaeraceae bacterium]|jgi:PAS domain S-box-containing protein|nr:ATP-binding protein [Tepidisphaeraceae bacterium]
MSEVVPSAFPLISRAIRRARPAATQADPLKRRNHSLSGYLLAILLALAAHLTITVAWHAIDYASFAVCVAAVTAAALFGGTGPGLLATVLLSLDLDYTFLPPYHSLVLTTQNLMRLTAFCAAAVSITWLQGRRHKAEESLRSARDELEGRVARRTAELFRSREQFRLLVDGFLDQAFFMLDGAGNVAGWNNGAQRLLGYAEAHIVGRPLTAIWPDADRRDTAVDPSRATDSASRYEHHEWIVRKDGSRFWGSIFLAHVDLDPANPIGRGGQAVTIRDLTERRTLEREILDISERERVRIGHDLHDGLGQELSGTALLSTALAQRLADADSARSTAEAAADAEQIADLIHESIRHTRELARGLCPLDMDEEGLPSSLRQLADRVARLPGIHCECQLPLRVGVESAVALHLHRITQEAINNAVRHGKASLINVRLVEENEQVTLIVADNGVGIPEAMPAGNGLGLRLMRYRAKMIGGSVQISCNSPTGTIVTCRVAACGIAAPGCAPSGDVIERDTADGGRATTENGHV